MRDLGNSAKRILGGTWAGGEDLEGSYSSLPPQGPCSGHHGEC